YDICVRVYHYAIVQLHFIFLYRDPASTEIYTLSLHDALPIFEREDVGDDADAKARGDAGGEIAPLRRGAEDCAAIAARFYAIGRDRKSTRLNSSHSQISYAVFCLKKKKNKT